MSPLLNLKTDRLDLHPLQLSDVEAMFIYRSLTAVYKYQQWAPRQLTEARDFVRKYSISSKLKAGNWKQLGIYLRKNIKLIGDCGFCVKGEQVEIGYTISPYFQGQGYGKEAVEALIDFLFRNFPIEKVIARTDPQNKPSIGLLKSLHFFQTGFFPRSIKIRGRWKDDVLFTLTKEVWDSKIPQNL